MIRKLKPEKDIAEVMEIWLKTNINAHHFVSEDYWKADFERVSKK